MKTFYIFDLDGVLIDSSHRYRTTDDGALDLAYWQANRWRAAHDRVITSMAQYYQALCAPSANRADRRMVLCTSRTMHREEWRSIAQFARTYGEPDHVLTRGMYDDSPSGILKVRKLTDLLHKTGLHGMARVIAYDDSLPNCQAIQDGIPLATAHHIPSAQGH